MINVYVESNFILEILLEQEDKSDCDSILFLAKNAIINLIIPEFAISEVFETVVRNAKNRISLAEKLSYDLNKFGAFYSSEEYTTFTEKIISFGDSMESMLISLEKLLGNILECAELIPISKDVVLNSFGTNKLKSPQDSIIYSSVIEHLNKKKSNINCFINKNSKDFDDPDVKKRIKDLDCKAIFQFNTGLRYINYVLRNKQKGY
jgi:predicted nucleic acid-binding protein